MKYERLTREQLEELHEEFAKFLATQQITKDEWTKIKQEKPKVAEEELDLFSDLVWEGVLNKVEFIEHFSPQQIFLFYFDDQFIHLIGIKVNNPAVDLQTTEGYDWLKQNLMNDDVDLYTSEKPITEDRNKDIFALIKQGARITKGELYLYFERLVHA
ncbi:DUF6495 family protein [Psychroflexus planctonicus]|uniref:Histidyl-tRNA synthetase n=1 Tax=Psychroflexus planctonicus TaxID=1526575 RepID=A0ABQ1SHZ7_9FLAO|nr:DUF6495 family protein [Psychroflexus planctonicus]GGE37391.1 hypothetical protein GCM10010832_17000 [Psychroflexus planctonicus]